jgi:D-arabinose 1-dehydrogenase-like Zn-dependent alcohol dehydrogenase
MTDDDSQCCSSFRLVVAVVAARYRLSLSISIYTLILQKHVMSLFQLLSWKKIKPHIAKKVSLDEVGLSHEKLEKGQVRGIVVCLPW